MSPPPLVAVGALNVDLVFRLTGPVAMRASNVAGLERRTGGVAANVARAFAREAPHGPRPLLVAAIGDDAPPGCEGVELLPVHRPGPSPTYAAVLDADGELHLGLAATELVETLEAADVLERIDASTPMLVDANLAPVCLTALAATNRTLVAMATSPEKALRLATIAARVDCLFCNRREAAALVDAAPDSPLDTLADVLTARGWRRYVLTDGPAALLVVEPGERTTVPVPRRTSVGTVNGAGDALAGAALVHWLAGTPLHRAVAEAGLSAAARILSPP